jgi:hypothetical protein
LVTSCLIRGRVGARPSPSRRQEGLRAHFP